MKTFADVLAKAECFEPMNPATEEQIVEAERVLGLAFAVEFRDYLLAYGCASCFGHEFTGICAFPRLNVVDATLRMRAERGQEFPAGWYVVEETGMDGVVVCQTTTGEVFATGPGYKQTYLCASLGEYLLQG